MRDPFSWSFPVGRMFGVTIRVHILFIVFVLGSVMSVAFWLPPAAHPEDKIPDGAWIDMCIILALLFLSVLAHEFGHAFGARLVGGDCQEILMWPLGGLASVDVPHTPRANFVTTAAGPAVNLLLCVVCALLLLVAHPTPLLPPLDPLQANFRDFNQLVALAPWGSYPWVHEQWVYVPVYSPAVLLGWLFWVNYVLFLLNMILVGFPMDGGRLLQSALWPHFGYRQATLITVFVGFVVAVLLGIYFMWRHEVNALCLCLFIGFSCVTQWRILETGSEDPLLGQYDFSQGYTSLERDEPPAPRVRRKSWWQRWLQERTAKKVQRELEQREAEEKRMDELLDKIQRNGRDSLTAEEQRFLKRVSERYRNRQ